MHRAEFFFPASHEIAAALFGALSPETRADVPKTTGRVSLEAEGVRVEIDADDISSLRAGVNSWLRWVDAAQKAARIGRG